MASNRRKLGTLYAEFEIQFPDFKKGIAKAQTEAKQYGQQIEQAMKGTKLHLSPTVDLSQLHALNREFDRKQAHHRQVQAEFDRKPLTPKVDDSNLKKLNQDIEKFQRVNKNTSVNVGVSADTSPLVNLELTLTRLERKRNVKVSVDASATIMGGKTGTRDIVQALDRVVSAVNSTKQGFGGQIFQGIANQFGFTIGSALQNYGRKELGFDLRKETTGAVKQVVGPIKAVFFDNPEARAAQERLAKNLGDKVKAAGYKIGDGLVAALNEEGGTFKQRLEAFMNASIRTDEFVKTWKEAIDDVRDYGRESTQAIFKAPAIKQQVEALGNVIGQYREQAIQDRAIPLVLQRAQEILNQKRTKNSAKLVTDQTENLIITTGGYAGARGLSGERIARDLRQDSKLKNTEVIWTRNDETDISKEARASKANPFLEQLGLTMGQEWVAGVAKSLATPNLRGFSNDAVEMAGQALAALERNPEIKIKLVGESGGGFVAEEAAAILKKMGVKNVEFLGVGTPNFMGGLNAPGQKIISPDEPLGMYGHVAGKYGAANPNIPSQQILGVKEHPYENYRSRMPAEMERFLYGPVKHLKPEDFRDLQQVAKEDAGQDFDAMSPDRLKVTAETALQNLEFIRLVMMDAEEELMDTLKDLAKTYKDIYLKTARSPADEPPSMMNARRIAKEASEVLVELRKNPGIESGLKAQDLKRQVQETIREFTKARTKYDGTLYEYVGTLAEKHTMLSEELAQIASQLDDPSLAVKQPLKPVETEVVFDTSDLAKKAEKETVGGNLIQRTVSAITNGISDGIETAGQIIKERIEDYVVNRINDVLMRVPGNPDLLDPSRQIGGIDELDLSDLYKGARIGFEDLFRGGYSATSRGMALMKGVESGVLSIVPAGQGIKGGLQKFAAPMALGVGSLFAPEIAGFLGGHGGVVAEGVAHAARFVEGGIAQGVGTVLSAPGELALNMAGDKIAEGTVALIRFAKSANTGVWALDQFTHALGAGLQAVVRHGAGQAGGGVLRALMWANEGAAGAVGWGVAPWIAGKTAMNLVGKGAQAALPQLPAGQVEANRQLQAATEKQIFQLKSAISTAHALASASPERAQAYIDTVKVKYPELAERIDAGIAALPPSARMQAGGGAEIAQLKSELAKAQKELAEAERRASKLSQFLHGVADMLTRPGEMMDQAIHDNIIDAEVIDVTPNLRSIAAGGSQQASAAKTPAHVKKMLQQQVDLAVRAVESQISDLGATFSQQSAALSNKKINPAERAFLAQTMEATLEEARQAIDDVIKSFGKDVPQSVRTAAKSARQKITAAGKKASTASQEAKDAGINIVDGVNEGIESRVASLKASAENMAEVVIMAAKNKLQIKSPSQVFRVIGEQTVQGYEQGLKGFSRLKNQIDGYFDNMKSAAEAKAKAQPFKIVDQMKPLGYNQNLVGQYRKSEDISAFFKNQSLQNEAKSEPTPLPEMPKVQSLAEKVSEAAKEGFKNLKDMAGAAGEVAEQMFRSLPGGNFLVDAVKTSGTLLKILGPVAIGLAGLEILRNVAEWANMAAQSIMQVVDAGARLEAVATKFDFNFGSDGARQLQEVTDTAVKFKQDITATRDSYLQFATAVRGTTLEPQAQNYINAISRASLVQGLPQEQLDRAQTATVQIAGKGRVYAEEVFGQLAEAMPNAPAVMGRALGTDIAGLRAKMKQGLSAESVLPKFFAQLEAESTVGASKAMDTTAAAMQNLSNQTQLLAEQTGRASLPIAKLGLNTLAKGAELASAAIGPLSSLVGGMLLGAVAKLAIEYNLLNIAMLKNLMTGRLLALAQSGLTGAWQGFTKIMSSSANSFAGWTAGALAAIGVGKMIAAVFGSTGTAASQFAKEAKQAFADYKKAADDAKNVKPPEIVNPNSRTDTRQSLLKYFIPGGDNIDDNLLTPIESAVRAPVQFFMQPFKTAGGALGMDQTMFDIPSFGQIQAQKNIIDQAAISGNADNIGAEMAKLFQSGDIEKMQGLRRQLESVQLQRRMLPNEMLTPEQAKLRGQLASQEKDITQQKTKLEQIPRMLLAQNAAAIEGYKKLREEAMQTGDLEGVARYSSLLDEANSKQKLLGELMDSITKSVERLSAELSQVADRLNEVNQAADITSAQGRVSTAAKVISGSLTSAQAEYSRFAQDQASIQTRIQGTIDAITQAQTILNDAETQRVLQGAGLSNESMPSDVRFKAATTSDSAEKDRLLAAADQITSIRQSRTDLAGLQAQLEESKMQAIEKLRDLAKSIYDFYRGIQVSAIEIQTQTKSLLLQSSAASAQNRLKSALIGFQESFTNDFVDALINLIDTLNKPLQQAIDAQQQIANAQQTYFQQLQQAYQLQNQMPTAEQVAALGGGVQMGTPGMQGQGQAQGQPGSGGMAAQSRSARQAQGTGQPVPMTPEQMAAAYNELTRIAPDKALEFSGKGLEAARNQAAFNYQQQLANIQGQQGIQASIASFEREMQISNAAYALTRANRQMRQTGIGLGRSVEDLQLQGMAQTPDVQLRGQLNGLFRQYQDQLRSFDEFGRGLNQTIEQQMMVRDQIVSGGLPEEFKQFLPQINETISNAQSELLKLNQNVAEFGKAYEQAVAEQRRLAELARKDREYAAQAAVENAISQEQQQRIAQFRAQGQGDVAADLEYRNRVDGINKQFRDQMQQLEVDTRTNPELAARAEELKASFERLRDSALATAEAEYNRAERERSLQLRQKQVELNSGLMNQQASILRAVPASGDFAGLQSQILANSGFGGYGSESAAKLLELTAQSDQLSVGFQSARDELDRLRGSLRISDEQFQSMSKTLNDTNALQQAALRNEMERVKRAQMPYTASVSEGGIKADRSDMEQARQRLFSIGQTADENKRLAETIRLMGQGGSLGVAARYQTMNDPILGKIGQLITASGASGGFKANELAAQIQSGQLTQGADLVARLDQLIAITKQQNGLLSRPNLTVNSIDGVGQAASIYSDLSSNSAMSAGF